MYNKFLIFADYCETIGTCWFMYSFYSHCRGLINVEVFLNFEYNWEFWCKHWCKWLFLRKLLPVSKCFWKIKCVFL